MRVLNVSEITENIKEMCIEANHYLSEDMRCAIQTAAKQEESALGRQILELLQENMQIAGEDMIPICQDTGMAVIFMEVGQDVHFEGGLLEEAVNEGVRQGYVGGFLRKSVVRDPIERENTKDNTPAVIHYAIVPGDKVKITVAPKGFGSENMSRVFMLKPADKCALLAKRALIRSIEERSRIPYVCELEKELLERINCSGIGPGGLGGTATALAVNIETYPTHIAGLPVAVNICCHVNRHAVRTI